MIWRWPPISTAKTCGLCGRCLCRDRGWGRRQQNLGSVLLKLRRFDDARAALEEALETQLGANDPTASLTRANLGWLELARGKPDRAREHAGAIAGNPEHATRSRGLLAAALVVEGKPSEARDLLAPLAPAPGTKEGQGDGVALAVLAAASRQLGENERSLELARAARERMSPAQRDELRAILPRVFSVLD